MAAFISVRTCVIALITTVSILAAFLAHLSSAHFAVPQEGLILITGASTGIGRAAAEHVARRHPYLTVLAGVRRAADASSIESLNVANLRPLDIDVADPGSVQRAFARIRELGKPLVGVVNNAGIARGPTPVEFHDYEDARALFEVNFFGVLRVTKEALPFLRTSRGRIVQISSVFGVLAPPQGGVYSASKFAVEALSDSLRREVGALGVSVSVVLPGAVTTPIFGTLQNASIAAAIERAESKTIVYPHLYTPADAKNEAELARLADSVSVTNDAIEHALTSRYPRTRYLVANIVGAPAAVLARIAWLLPDRVFDALLAAK
jgi:NAD(P)-dependent dehydrogenase (short-subunit alcohol dehydrogenase family)